MILSETEIQQLLTEITAPCGDKCNKGYCDIVDKILADICETKLTKEMYRHFAPYRHPTVSHMIRNEVKGCSMGNIFVTTKDSMEWASVIPAFNPMYDKNACKNTEIFVIFVGIDFHKFPTSISKSDTASQLTYILRDNKFSSHSSIIVGNDRNKTLERIETNGQAPWNEPVDDALQEFFAKENGDYKYIRVTDSCPYIIGAQQISHDDFCGHWSTLLAYLRIKCPNITTFDLQKFLRDKGRVYLVNLIQHWHCYSMEYAKNHNIMKVGARLENVSDAELAMKLFNLYESGLIDEVNQKLDEANIPEGKISEVIPNVEEKVTNWREKLHKVVTELANLQLQIKSLRAKLLTYPEKISKADTIGKRYEMENEKLLVETLISEKMEKSHEIITYLNSNTQNFSDAQKIWVSEKIKQYTE